MIELTESPIDIERVRAAIESPVLGGVAIFLGEVRSLTGERATSHLFYEAYNEMALKKMHEIAAEAKQRWNGGVAMVHRLGMLQIGDVAVVTAAACPHRAEAFDCCRFLIDSLKADVPIWKKEFGPDGQEWI